jgi:hypothetical protein
MNKFDLFMLGISAGILILLLLILLFGEVT